MKSKYYLYLSALAALASCSPKGPYSATNKVYKDKTEDYLKTISLQDSIALVDSTGAHVPSEWVGTVNFGIRKPNFVIIHFTAQDSVKQTLHTFTVTHSQVSAHYVVAKDGKVYHMVNDYFRANHAGVGKWGSVTDMNSSSIGIEIDNNGSEPYTDAQVKSLLALLLQLKKAYTIPTANFIGHQDWAPKRKPDPGPLFPWKLMAQYGIGYWRDEILETPPENFDYATALRLMGYDTRDLNACVVAFKRHFVQTDVTPTMTEFDLSVLYNIYKKYQ